MDVLNSFNQHFLFEDPRTWNWPELIVFQTIIFFALQIFSLLVNFAFSPISEKTEIPIRKTASGTKNAVRVLEKLETIDLVFISFSKFMVTVFTYHVYVFTWSSRNVEWDPSKLSFGNTIGALVGLYLVYDFFYTLFHRFLHVRGLYKYIHKHHHRQMAPYRGNLDAINVHPIEFVGGEYLHLLSLWIVPTHAYTVLVFIAFDGLFATLNHTRFNVIIPPSIFAVKAHDTHHHLPNYNFGQYLTFWDRVFGFYKDHWMDLEGDNKKN